MHEVLAEQPEDEDPGRSRTMGTIVGSIRFSNVSFEYEAGKPVLKNISFEGVPGSVTALVGPSGSGKSTLIGLVAAFAKPTSGTVLVDDVDLSTVSLDSYRSQLGVVLQDNFLFDGTIRENILFGRPDASGEEVIRAARIARVDEFAEKFEKQYETIVGERGVKLSGGQRQRVAIARAILASPRILILDEATSSLDSESEAYIQEGLAALMKGRTTFVIAHRMSTIRGSNQILVLEDGQIVERGTHDQLFKMGGRYFGLYTKQAGLESNRFLNPGERVPDESPMTIRPPDLRVLRKSKNPRAICWGSRSHSDIGVLPNTANPWLPLTILAGTTAVSGEQDTGWCRSRWAGCCSRWFLRLSRFRRVRVSRLSASGHRLECDRRRGPDQWRSCTSTVQWPGRR